LSSSASIRKILGCLSLLGCVLLFSFRAHATDVADEADVEFSLGAERYEAHDYTHALAHFLASNRLARNRNVLFNIARCYEQTRQFPEAHRYYSRALEGETDSGASGRIKEALARISPRVAIVRIVSDPPGARIYLDRKDLGERGSTPQTMALPPARYRVIAELDGFEDAVSDATELVIGRERSISLKLHRIVGTIRVTGGNGGSVRLDVDNASESCIAPCDLKAAPGQHTIILGKAGFRTVRTPVLVEADKTSALQLELVPETGSLVVNSDERGASIEIDGATQGFTPAILAVPVGAHRVRIDLHGFRPVERQVVIHANLQTQLSVDLLSSDSIEAASRISESIEDAPASVSLVSAQELRAMRYPTLAEALRGIRGIFLSDDRGYQSLGFRGFSRLGSYGNRVLITLDGVPLNDDWVWSSYVGSDLRTDLEDIDRIEVVRGPGSVVYGTSAFSGVVNLVTRSKEVSTGHEVGVSVAGDGLARARARITQHFGTDAGVWASVSAGKSAGRDFFFPEYVADGPATVAGNARGVDGARMATLTGKAWWKQLTLSWSLHRHDKRLPTGEFETLLGDGRTHQADTRGFVELRFEPQLGSKVASLTRLHGNYYGYRADFARSPGDGGLEWNRYDSSWAGVEQRFVATPSEHVSASVGGEVQDHPRARQQGGTETPPSYVLDDTRHFVLGAVYGSLDVRPFDALKLSAGGRLDYYSTFGASFNPRLAVILRPYAGGNIKVLAGKAFRAPSVYELWYSAVGQIGNSRLRPENIYSAEIEWSHRFSPAVIATAAVYMNYIENLISLVDVPDMPGTVQNINTTTPLGTLGGELELRRDWKEGWMAAASYSVQRTVYLASKSFGSLVELKRSADFREVPNAPTQLASIRGAVPILSRALTLMTRLSVEQGRYDRADSMSADGPQGQTATALFWDFVFTGTEARWGLNYSLGVYNAFDSRAQYPVSAEFRQRSIPVTGRSLLASGSLTF
jgi:outer membrane cobalamin receptor